MARESTKTTVVLESTIPSFADQVRASVIACEAARQETENGEGNFAALIADECAGKSREAIAKIVQDALDSIPVTVTAYRLNVTEEEATRIRALGNPDSAKPEKRTDVEQLAYKNGNARKSRLAAVLKEAGLYEGSGKAASPRQTKGTSSEDATDKAPLILDWVKIADAKSPMRQAYNILMDAGVKHERNRAFLALNPSHNEAFQLVLGSLAAFIKLPE